MFEILLAICLQADPAVCATRVLPPSLPDAAACAAAAPGRAGQWAGARDRVIAGDWACVDAAGLARAIPPAGTVEVAPGAFVHRGLNEIPSPANVGDLANTGFVIGEAGVAVIDAGGSRASGERLYAAIRQRTDLPIRWLILTHMHPDHTLGASVFAEAGAEILGHAKLADALARRAETYETRVGRLVGPAAAMGMAVVAPDPEGANPAAGQALTLDIGGRELELRGWPTAHTDNDLTVLDRQTDTLFTGDLVFAEHTPAIDGSLRGWQAALGILSARPAARIVPGHGPHAMPWPEGGAAVTGYLAALAAETRAAIDKGESMRDAIAHVGESQRDKWALFDEFNKRNATVAYKELEWE